ncbi:MAG: class I SAM-dependent methyltransferase [bacterium]|nr:class I SAM-dependent methyltransferase [bacterium]
MTTEVKNSHEKVSPTAWGVAAQRAVCDIPFAKEVLDELTKVMTSKEREQMTALSEKNQKLTPQFEARHKLLNRFLKETGIHQILELAAGVTSRGIDMTQDKKISYVELDLPGIARQKREIVASLVRQGKIQQPENLEIFAGSALDDLSEATAHFDTKKPIAVVHEGLLRYLNFEEKTRVIKNVRKLLQKFGGVYITCDITLRIFIDERQRMLVSNMVGMDINANAFENVEAAERFFSELGFTIEKHSFLEAQNSLVSPPLLGLSADDVLKVLRDPVFFVMRLKNS